jgi:ferritin heavy chain
LLQSAYFSRDDVALNGFAHLFSKNSSEEREHAMKLVEYQNKRGGRVVFQDVARPGRTEWGSALEAVEAALDLEKNVNQVRDHVRSEWKLGHY